MARIDLDAARKARAEARGKQERKELKIAGKRYTLPVECPVDYSIFLVEGDPRLALRALVGDKWQEIWQSGLSIEDMNELTIQIADLYGLGKPIGFEDSENSENGQPGESRASGS